VKKILFVGLAACLALPAIAFGDDPKPAPKPRTDRDVDKLPITPMKPFNPPAARRVELPNGITLFLMADHELPLIEIRATIRAGGIWDSADKVGLSSIAGEVWRTGGTKTHPKEALDALLDMHGATLETSVGRDSGSIHLSVLKEDLDLGLSLMKELLTEPLFPEDKLGQAKRERISGINRRNDQAPPVANRIFEMQVFGKASPFAREAEKSTIGAIKREDLVAWHQHSIRPANFIVGAYGDAETAVLEKKVGAAIGDWKASGDEPARPEMPLVDVTRKASFTVIDKDDVNQSAVVIGHVGGVRTPDGIDDYAKIIVMNEILGGGGFTSRLMGHVRSDMGLAYSVYSTFGQDYDHPGTLELVCETKSETTAKASKAMLAELDAIRTTECTDEELAVAKESLLNQIPFWVDTTDKVMDRTMSYAYRSFPQDTLKKFAEGVSKVTRADVLKAAQTTWHPDALTYVVCGNKKEFDAPIESLANGAKVEVIEDPDAWVTGAKAMKEVPAPETTPEGKKPEAPASPSAQPVAPKDGTELLAKVVEKMGGKKNLDALTAIKTKDKITRDEAQMSAETTVQFPDKVRQVITSEKGSITIIFDGKNGWGVIPGQGTMKLPPAQIAAFKDSLDGSLLALLRSAAKGELKAMIDGEDKIDGKAVSKLTLTREGGKKSYSIYVDEAGVVVAKDEDGKGGDKQRVHYSDLKEVGGVLYPMTQATKGDKDAADAEPHQLKIVEKAEANPKVDDKTFAAPAGGDEDE
jgi:predicted Zn-dependent peptidase